MDTQQKAVSKLVLLSQAKNKMEGDQRKEMGERVQVKKEEINFSQARLPR